MSARSSIGNRTPDPHLRACKEHGMRVGDLTFDGLRRVVRTMTGNVTVTFGPDLRVIPPDGTTWADDYAKAIEDIALSKLAQDIIHMVARRRAFRVPGDNKPAQTVRNENAALEWWRDGQAVSPSPDSDSVSEQGLFSHGTN